MKQDCTWQMILKSFDFQPEVRKIEHHLAQGHEDTLNLSGVGLTEEIKTEIREVCFRNECEFDLKTVQDFVGSSTN